MRVFSRSVSRPLPRPGGAAGLGHEQQPEGGHALLRHLADEPAHVRDVTPAEHVEVLLVREGRDPPLGALALWQGWRVLDESRDPERGAPLDLVGVLLGDDDAEGEHVLRRLAQRRGVDPRHGDGAFLAEELARDGGALWCRT